MFCKSKRIAILMLGILIVIALFVGCAQDKPLEPVRLDDGPMVAYMKLEGKVDGKFTYSLKVCPFDGEPQVITYKCLGLKTAGDGNCLYYDLRVEDDLLDLYYMDRTGTSHLVTDEVIFYDLCENGNAVIYGKAFEADSIFLKAYLDDGALTNEETFDNIWTWDINSLGNIIMLLIKQQEDDPVGDIYLYKDGQMEKAVENGQTSLYDHAVSDDGTILYLADSDGEGDDILWTLYRKERGRDAEKLVTDCTSKTYISNDSGLSAAIVVDDNGKEVLFYQYVGEAPVFVEDIVQFEMSEDSNTLYYMVGDRTNWRLPLYKVTKGTEPVLVAENVAVITDVSKDGKSAAFAANFDRENIESEIYIAREGEKTEFVDDGIMTSEFKGKIVHARIILYYDGSAIAYQKGAHDEYGQFTDLYVKEKGKEPRKIDEVVIDEFDFLR